MSVSERKAFSGGALRNQRGSRCNDKRLTKQLKNRCSFKSLVHVESVWKRDWRSYDD